MQIFLRNLIFFFFCTKNRVYHICVFIKSHFRNFFIVATNCSDFMIHLNCEKIECLFSSEFKWPVLA